MGIASQPQAALQSSPISKSRRVCCEPPAPGREGVKQPTPLSQNFSRDPWSIQQEEKEKQKKKPQPQTPSPGINSRHGSTTGRVVCILQAPALSRLSEPRWEKGQNPAEMKEWEAPVRPPLAFTPGGGKGKKKKRQILTHRHLTKRGANEALLPRSGRWSGAGNAGSISRYLRGQGCR